MSTVIRLLFVAFSLFTVSTLQANEVKNWPREITSEEGKITIFQPEVESFTDDKMVCRSAVMVELKNQSSPAFGAIWFKSRLATDRDNRTVTLLDLNIEAYKFPDFEDEEVEKINSYVEQEVPQWEMVMSLDEILTSLEYSEKEFNSSEQLNNKAPEIIFKTTPTALISIDGEPIWTAIDYSDFDYVANSPFFILRQQSTGNYYLKGGSNWYTSTNLYSDWSLTTSIPKALETLDSANDTDDSTEETTEPSEIIIKTTPAELLVSNGSPQYSSVENTSLLYMSNTDEDIILNIKTQEYYVLISGRWYKSKDLNGNNWTFVAPDSLPEDFAEIPEHSPVKNVRSSVSGTQEAKEAVLETQIPQTAEVSRASASLEVAYDGDPIFEPIDQTGIYYAINTNQSVLLIDNVYYCCDDAVWFQSNSPTGGWVVAVSVPNIIMSIPPSYPVYNLRYVRIYGYTPDVVYVGYLQGYVQNYIYHGCVFYGTGYRYDPWYSTYYFPRPLTYGFGAHYNPYSGWGFSYGVYFGGFGWIDYGIRYRSYYAGYWGPSGYRHGYYRRANLGKRRGYSDKMPRPPKDNNRKQKINQERLASNNVYMKRDNGVKRTGDYQLNPKNGKQIGQIKSEKNRAQTVKRNNDLYSDKSGNVYKRNNNGSWESQNNHKNTSTNQQPNSTRQTQSANGRNNAATQQSLNRQYQSRSRSTQRTNNYNNNRTQNTYTQPSRQTRSSSSVQRSSRSSSQQRSTPSRSSSSGKRRR